MDPEFKALFEDVQANLDEILERESTLPIHLADQIDAISKHGTPKVLRQVGDLAAAREGWDGVVHEQTVTRVKASLMFAAFAQLRRCQHFLARSTAARLGFVLLPCQVVLCQPCLKQGVPPPVRKDDQCDLCGERGVPEFHPIAIGMGSFLVSGDICADCWSIVSGEED